MKKIKTAAAYCRFSSDNQRSESIDAQLRAIKEYCKRNKIKLIKIYADEALSGTSDKRAQFQQMIDDSKSGKFNLVIVHKLDRFARDRYDSAVYKRILRDNGVTVVSVLENLDDSPESVILESVLEGMSEYYSKNLAREVRKGQNENALKCVHNGGIPPLGYDLDENKKYIINEVEAEAVKKIFEMYTKGYGYLMICNELNAKGYKTKLGRPFSKTSIHDLLKNEKYRGVYVWNKRLSKKTGNRKYKDTEDIIRIEGGVPRIISDDIWYLAQSLQHNNLKPRRRGKYFYILTGKLFCGECGYSMCGRRGGSNRNGTPYYAYACNNRKSGLGCKAKIIGAPALEKKILDVIKETFLTDQAINILCSKIKEYLNKTVSKNTALLNDLTKKKKEIQRKQEKLLDLYLSDKISMDMLNSKSEQLTLELDNINLSIQNETMNNEIIFDEDKIKEFLNSIKDQYSLDDPDTKKKLIDTFVYRIDVFSDHIKVNLYCDKALNLDFCSRMVEPDRAKPKANMPIFLFPVDLPRNSLYIRRLI